MRTAAAGPLAARRAGRARRARGAAALRLLGGVLSAAKAVRPPLILASGSPQRKKLLRELGLPFRVEPSRVGEESSERNPRRLVLELAVRKARSVARKHPRGLVLGADTVVACAGEILVKPVDLRDAKRILGRLNGRWHRVYTGVALIDAETGRLWREAAVSRVKARRLPAETLERLAGKHLDKAGGYAVQDTDDPFIEEIDGPFDNVVGLPLQTVRRLLKKVALRRSAKRPPARRGSR